jgi:hypothetical protein
VFEGQIVEGTKTLVNDPNRYEMVLLSGTTISIEDTGQIQTVLMDGQALENPLQQGGRGRLLDMIRNYDTQQQAAENEERRKTMNAMVDWMLGTVEKRGIGKAEKAVLTQGSRIYAGEEILTQANSRARLKVADRVLVGLEDNTLLRIKRIQIDENRKKFILEFELAEGRAWVDSTNPEGQAIPVDLSGSGLRFDLVEGLFQFEQTLDGNLILSHFRGPDVQVHYGLSDQPLRLPSASKLLFTEGMLTGRDKLEPKLAQLDKPDSWIDFIEWKPRQIDLPLMFQLVGALEMKPKPVNPILGLSTEGFVFQDLQPIVTTGLAPLMKQSRFALHAFRKDVGRFPTVEEGLAALRIQPAGVDTWKGPYLNIETPDLDLWDRPLHYSLIDTPAGQYINLYSLGANGQDEGGLGDDLR